MENNNVNSNVENISKVMKSKGNAKRLCIAFLIQSIVFFTSVIVLFRMRSGSMDECWNSLGVAAQSTDSHISGLLSNFEGALTNMVREVNSAEDPMSPKIVSLFQSTRLGALNTPIRLYYPDGRYVTEQEVNRTGSIDLQNRYNSIYSSNNYVSSIQDDIYNPEKKVISLFVPVSNESGNIIAMIEAVVNTSSLRDELLKENINLFQPSYIIVVDRDGTVIVDTSQELKGNFFEMQKISDDGYDFQQFLQDVVDKKESRYAFVNEKNNESTYLASIPSKIDGWSTMVEVDENVAMKSERNMTKGIVAILSAEFVCFLIYIIWLWRNLKGQYLEEVKREKEELKKFYEKDSMLYQKAILDTAYSYFKVNLTKNIVIPPIIERVNGEPMDYTAKFGKNLPTYDDIIIFSADRYADSEYRTAYKEKLSRKYLLGQYIDGNMMPEFVTKLNSSIIGWHYRKYISYLSEDKETHDVICMNVAYDISDEILHEQEEKNQRSVIEALADDYECLVCLYLDKPHVDFYRVSDNFKRLPEIWRDGVEDSERVKLFIDEFVAEEDVQRFIDEATPERLVDATSHGKPFRVNCRLKIKGESKWYQLKYVNHVSENNTHSVIAAYRNIDDEIRRQSKHQEEMEQALLKAENANKAKTQFLFNMSHDIRTPMNAVIGFADLAEKNIDDKEKMTSCLTKLKKSSKQLLNIINDVLEVSRIESGQISLNLQPFDMRKGSKSLRPIFEPLFQEKDLQINIHGSGRDFYVLADYQRINRVVFNVLSNAVKYTPKGGLINYTIEQIEDRDDGRVQYKWTISDNGVGMSKEYLDKIYERFTREKSTTESGIEGTGLGMSMVKDFIDMMDGTIHIESEQGKGTSVEFIIPFKKCNEDLVRMLDGPAMNSLLNLKGKKILIVEDLEINREIAVEMLEDEGIICKEAADGMQAVEIVADAQNGDFDLILMDIQMPKMNGYEATRAIRSMKNCPLSNIPIIAMTANAFEEDRKAALEAGMNEHLAKPVTADKLRTVISRFL